VIDDAASRVPDLRVRSVMELGVMRDESVRLDDGSKPRRSRSVSRADVQSNHGGRFPSAASSEDCGPPRRLNVSWPLAVSLAIPQAISLSASLFISKSEDSYQAL
jgi:hypothetical protein